MHQRYSVLALIILSETQTLIVKLLVKKVDVCRVSDDDEIRRIISTN